MNKLLASAFYSIEVGRARSLVRLIPLFIVVMGIIGSYDLRIYKGFNDQQSMDNAQLARQIARHQGFLTYFIRPYALAQMTAYAAKHGQRELFPDKAYPAGTPRAIPDTYNSPGYPVLLAWYDRILGIDFDESSEVTARHRAFGGDRWLPPVNQAFVLLTAGVMFVMALRLFDERVAWMSSVVLVFSDFVWNDTLQATPIVLLMLLMTILLFGFVEVHRIGEVPVLEGELPSLGWAWLIVPALAVLFGLMCLLSLPLVALTLPLVAGLLLLPRTNWFFLPIFAGIVAVMVGPWFFHWFRTCGNPFGSNVTLGLLGREGYTGNQVFCNTTIPIWDNLLGATGSKQYTGFVWYFERGWDLFGSNPMVLFFAAALLHEFRRPRVQALRWLVVGLALAIVATTNLANAQPDPAGSWNLVVVLLPVMIMIGTAFFFVLLDRMVTQLRLLTITLIVGTLALCVAPILTTFMAPALSYYNYPPYLPPYLSYLTRLAPADKWVTSDMPWATSWYGDRVSLWVPDTLADFSSIYDNDCESFFILFTQVTLGKPALTLTSGELKEWMPLLFTFEFPDSFPIRRVVKLPAGGPEYIMFSEHFRSDAH